MDVQRLHDICGRYGDLSIAVFGDFCLDRYLEIDPERGETSIETGLPVHNVTRVRSQPGGAGTILCNVCALGIGEVFAVGFCGEDGEAYELMRALNDVGANTDHFLQTADRNTFTYTKPLVLEAGKPPRELNRLDIKNWTETPASVETHLIESLNALMGRIDGIVIMEQMDRKGLGAVTPRIKKELAVLAKSNGKTVFLADSRKYIGEFREVTIKINENELADHFGKASPDGLDVQGLAAEWAADLGQRVFVTLGANGTVAARPDGQTGHVPGIQVTGEIDIVGAGDSVSAGITCALAAGATELEAAALGNLAGSVVIQKLGTTGTASVAELADALTGAIA
jgi:rfaE bifunctional protein kinase chain/domain